MIVLAIQGVSISSQIHGIRNDTFNNMALHTIGKSLSVEIYLLFPSSKDKDETIDLLLPAMLMVVATKTVHTLHSSELIFENLYLHT